jgi:hypothetical protein
LAYCLHVTLAGRLQALAPGLTPRSVLEKFAAVRQKLDKSRVTYNKIAPKLTYFFGVSKLGKTQMRSD